MGRFSLLILLVPFLVLRSHGLHVSAELADSDSDFESEGSDSMHGESGLGDKVYVCVNDFGAVGDGQTDDTKAFVDAWAKACSASNSVLLVPEDGRYLVNTTIFQGPCPGKLTIQIEGTIIAPDNPNTWNPKYPRLWLVFYNLSTATFKGNGVIDGAGAQWWASSCKRNKTNPCREGPTALTIQGSSDIKVKDLTIQNGQQMNFIIASSNRVRVSNVQVSAPGDSPNTDGIHIVASTNVSIRNCTIRTGDDCISIVTGSSGILMKKLTCGPCHGISIGSLGKGNSVGIVEDVVLDTASLTSTTNGLRIKTWQGGQGHVTNVHYKNVEMINVSNPIIIDQFYCEMSKSCKNQTSAVKISNIVYRKINGTSQTNRAMAFSCSDTVPCTGIQLKDIQLSGMDGKAVETYCNSASGSVSGHVQPSADCLLPHSGKDSITLQRDDKAKEGAEGSSGHIIYTEL